MTEEVGSILVMGVGNPLMLDEGIGPRVVELLLNGFTFPENVEVVDAGTMSFMILDLLRGVDHLIIIDAMKGTEHPAGTVMRLTPEDLAPNQVMHSLHDMRVVDVLQAADAIGQAPETIIIGMQIESIQEFVLELSEPCAAALPVALAAVMYELEQLGVLPEVNEDGDIDAGIIQAMRTFAPMPEPQGPTEE